jgi:iron complex transport system ATP-binding protein
MASSPLLQIRNLIVSYTEHHVLEDISLSLDAGSVLVVIGPNGAGKTTLIRALSGVVPAVSGSLVFEGRNLDGLSNSERARIFAVVPQARNLPPAFTAWETVALGRTPHLNWLGQTSEIDEEIVRETMRQTDTLALTQRRVGELSGGEQQRLLLARALAQQPRVLLLDEPVTHLDLHYQITILDQIRELAKEKNLGVLAVLHDINMAVRFADQTALLVGGKLVAVGSPAEVLTPTHLSTAYDLPEEIFKYFIVQT